MKGNLPLASGLLILGGLLLVAALAPYLAPYDPGEYARPQFFEVDGQLRFTVPPFAPSAEHPLGTDASGRDVLSGLLFGARYTLVVVAATALARFALALPLGLWAAWRGGRVKSLLSDLATAAMAVPQVVLAFFLLRESNIYPGLGPYGSLFFQVTVLTLLGVPRLADTLHRLTEGILQEPFIEGARAVGAPPAWIGRVHLLPHLMPHAAVLWAMESSQVLWLVGQLGVLQVFLGGGTGLRNMFGEPIRIMTGEWGGMLAENLYRFMTHPWLGLGPAVAIFAAILGLNLLAEGLRRHWRLHNSY